MDLFLTNMQLFFHNTSADGLEWGGLLVDYCDVFISCLDSHSDGTHSLQRIHWWASDGVLHFSKSVPMKKQTHLYLGCLGSKCQANERFCVNCSFKQCLIFNTKYVWPQTFFTSEVKSARDMAIRQNNISILSVFNDIAERPLTIPHSYFYSMYPARLLFSCNLLINDFHVCQWQVIAQSDQTLGRKDKRLVIFSVILQVTFTFVSMWVLICIETHYLQPL